MFNKKKKISKEMSADEMVRQLLENLGEEPATEKEAEPAALEAGNGGGFPPKGKYGAVYRFRVTGRQSEKLPVEDPAPLSAAEEEPQPLTPEKEESERLRAEALAESIHSAEEYVNDLADRVAATGESLPIVTPAEEEVQTADDLVIGELEAGDVQEEITFEVPGGYDETPAVAPTGTTDEFAEISDLAKEAVAEAEAAEAAQPAEQTGETDSPIAGLDEVDVNLMDIFGMDKELQEQIGTDEFRRLRGGSTGEDLSFGGFPKEYESPEENKSFFAHFKSAWRGSCIRLGLGVLLLLVAAVLELGKSSILAGKANPEYLIVYTLGMLQITLFLTALAMPEIIRGLRALFKGKPLPELVVATGCLTNLIYEIVLLSTKSLSGTVTFNMPLAVCVIMGILYRMLTDRRDLMTFKVISSRHPKYAVAHLQSSDSTLEKDAFSEFLNDNSEIFGVRQTDFVGNFAARSSAQGAGKGLIGIILPAAILSAVIFFVLGYFHRTGGNFASNFAFGASVAQLCFMFILPCCCFLGYILPFFRASGKAYRQGSAIIGDGALDEYADATVISFNDDSIFPEGNVKLRSMRLYGNNRIDVVLYKTASVFEKLGGPLRTVFHAATKDFGHSDQVELNEIRKNGVDAVVDGTPVLIGSAAYLREQGIQAPVAEGDEALEYQSQISIMYITIDGMPAGKFYVEYRLERSFEGIVKALYRSGMCIGIRTLDPNIDDAMLDRRIKLSKYPVRVLKCRQAKELGTSAERLSSGVISKRSVKDLLTTLTSCEKVAQITRWNLIFSLIAMVAGLAITALLFIFDHVGTVSPAYIALYQLFWMIPTGLVSWLLI